MHVDSIKPRTDWKGTTFARFEMGRTEFDWVGGRVLEGCTDCRSPKNRQTVTEPVEGRLWRARGTVWTAFEPSANPLFLADAVDDLRLPTTFHHRPAILCWTSGRDQTSQAAQKSRVGLWHSFESIRDHARATIRESGIYDTPPGLLRDWPNLLGMLNSAWAALAAIKAAISDSRGHGETLTWKDIKWRVLPRHI
ncbi:hypothetical protein N7462_005372 [Penicillium macrosclerotiorum]|uniref:uncharacterized protein n=1 Tax=Penicillium macrosclerotiorum TaxID=303699 RepID=UPI002548D0BB|nr:uncharacterized protein N7462_005372 [Penicillium macrosclerotiorum]KAJ5682207.1 hypothetical protein N7462_005372 [Penicillium macrosclerotiorum]